MPLWVLPFATCSFRGFFYTHERLRRAKVSSRHTNPYTPTCVKGQRWVVIAKWRPIPAIMMFNYLRIVSGRCGRCARSDALTHPVKDTLGYSRTDIALNAGIGIIDL